MKVEVSALIVIITLMTSCASRQVNYSTDPNSAVKTDLENIPKAHKSEQEVYDSLVALSIIWDSIRLVKFRENAFKFAGNTVKGDPVRQISREGKIVVLHTPKKILYFKYRFNGWQTKLECYDMSVTPPFLMWEEIWDMGFEGDTVRDINGDNKPDILTRFYSTSGCCMRNSYTIRLFNAGIEGFDEKIKMMNPTFYPDEKTVRGIGYGHPGLVPLYKMKWAGNQLDTIEYIYPFPEEKGKFWVSDKRRPHSENDSLKNGKVIYSLPEEYKKIKGIDWFLKY